MSDLTVDKLLLPSEDEPARGWLLDFETSPAIRTLKDALAKHGALRGRGTLAMLVSKLRDLLDIAIVEDVFVKVWNEAHLFRRYLDPSRYPATETVAVPLAEHTITSTHRPYLEIRINDTVVQRLDFEITLRITVQGVILEIQDGRITKVRTGECAGKVELRCEGLLLASEKLETTRFPGEKTFKDGIPIAP